MQRNYFEEIKTIIESEENDTEKKNHLLQYHESDIALVIPELEKADRLKLYRILGDEITSEVFSYLDNVEEYVDELDENKAADIIELMDVDDAIDVLDELDDEDREKIINLMDDEAVDDIELVSKYEDDEIGSKITTNYVAINKTMSVKVAMKQVIKEAADNDNVSVIYVLDQNNKYYGSLDLRDLIIARENDNLDKYVKTSYPFLFATDKVDDCINKLKDQALDSVPVLNDKMELIGVITSSDIVETVDEVMSDDYAKLAGLTSEEDLDESTFKSVKKRLPWLIILLVLGLVVSSLISSFEAVVVAIPMIVFFQSVILDMAGNTGTQSLAVTIRILADEKISGKVLLHTVFKEVRVGFANGLILAVISFGAVLAFLTVTQQPIKDGVYNITEALMASGIISISLLASMTVCSLVGTTIPIFFMKLKIDPAVASGPFITTINDVIAVVIYYGLAALVFLSV